MAFPDKIRLNGAKVDRFRRQLDALVPSDVPVGVAVSGGPDSLALLLLAAEARPLLVEAATVDHALRPGSDGEAAFVAEHAARLAVPHRTLAATWDTLPTSAIQERARAARYGLLARWARERKLGALVTAHHLDDQAETFVMRLRRGAGVKGLACMRPVARTPHAGIMLVRPLLGWRRSELEEICAEAGFSPVSDPSNEDERFERVRVRRALRDADLLEPQSLAASAAHLAQADSALQWAANLEWNRGVTNGGGDVVYRPTDAPRDIRRRIVHRAVLRLASEGQGSEMRGGELDRLLAVLAAGGKATLRGVLCSGGKEWRFTAAPPRRAS